MLDNLLEKLHINYEDLNEQEKRTYKEWDSALNGPEVTTADLRRFLPTFIEGLEHQQNQYDNTPTKDLFLKASIRNAKMILAFITGPDKRREWVKRSLEQRIKQ